MRFAVLVLLAVGCSSKAKPPDEKRKTPATIDAAQAQGAPGLRLPDGVTPLAYDVRLELDPEREQFSGHVEIRVRVAAPIDRVWLHAEEIEIEKVRVGDREAKASAPTEHQMIALEAPASGETTIVIDYVGRIGEEENEGLFRQKFGGKWFIYSQAEATFARRIVPCFDEPKFKVPWRVTLVVPDGLVALANAPMESERVVEKKREVKFAPMPAMPAHLFAVTVGPFTLVDLGKVGKNAVPVRAAVGSWNVKSLGPAKTWVPKVVDALELYLDRPLPLAKLDLVAVPRFFGAMENPGLIMFEVTALVGDEKRPEFLRRHVRFLAHEIAHQWFGNSVTPAWWDDLWLAEAFATWLDDKMSNTLGTLDDPALRTQLARAHALAADREAAAKPIRRTIETTDDIEDSFDAISYEKGAAVIAMYEQFVGEDKFRDIMRTYVKRDRIATAKDFLDLLASIDAPLAKSFTGYLDRIGAPVVEMTLDCATNATVTVTPRDGAAVPVCLRGKTKTCQLVTAASQFLLAACERPIGNADGRGYYSVNWRGKVTDHFSTPRPPTTTAPTPAERLAHGEDRAASIGRNDLRPADAMAEVDALVATKDPYDELAALAIAGAIDRTQSESAVGAWHARLAKTFAKRLGADAIFAPKTPIEFATRDAIIELVPPAKFPKATTDRAKSLVEVALKDGLWKLKGNEISTVVALSAPGGKAIYEKIVNAAAKMPSVGDIFLEGLAFFDASFAPRAVELALDKRFEPDRAWIVAGGMLAHPATRSAAWRAVKSRLGELLAVMGAADSKQMIEATASLCTKAERDEVAAAFQPHASTIAGGTRALEHSLAAIDRCVKVSGSP